MNLFFLFVIMYFNEILIESKLCKMKKNVIFEDECFNVHNLINSVISYIDENIEEMKIINKKDIANINKYKFDKILFITIHKMPSNPVYWKPVILS